MKAEIVAERLHELGFPETWGQLESPEAQRMLRAITVGFLEGHLLEVRDMDDGSKAVTLFIDKKPAMALRLNY